MFAVSLTVDFLPSSKGKRERERERERDFGESLLLLAF